jgi:phage shock protein A
MNTETRNSIQDSYRKIVLWVLLVLTDLRSDLATRLTEQKQSLESAKTEVEKNITGTPELLAVSEAQKLRLDRQIEQFEELQRVLVRV